MIRHATLDELKSYARGKCPVEYMKLLGVESFVEIGIREGKSFFGSHVHGIKDNGIAYAIDIWKNTGNPAQNDANLPQTVLDTQYQLVLSKASDCNANVDVYESGARVVVLREFSYDAPKVLGLPPQSIDWVFIDGDHSYEGCMKDLRAWYPMVKPGGVLCGHDYMTSDVYWNGVRCGVKQAVDEFFSDKEEVFVYTNSPNPTWYIVKDDHHQQESA